MFSKETTKNKHSYTQKFNTIIYLFTLRKLKNFKNNLRKIGEILVNIYGGIYKNEGE
jgi:hypothetical protein